MSVKTVTKKQNNGKSAKTIRSDKTVGSIVTQSKKPSSAKGSAMSESDKLTMKAWKRTYANRNNHT